MSSPGRMGPNLLGPSLTPGPFPEGKGESGHLTPRLPSLMGRGSQESTGFGRRLKTPMIKKQVTFRRKCLVFRLRSAVRFEATGGRVSGWRDG